MASDTLEQMIKIEQLRLANEQYVKDFNNAIESKNLEKYKEAAKNLFTVTALAHELGVDIKEHIDFFKSLGIIVYVDGNNKVNCMKKTNATEVLFGEGD